eukprot:TRINITY_DN966_c0_g1_i1.p1 TRINITY_DN966_c0_g1~~TRINITY_DN966_c0_g1_i1.p1  ORF type:complete len:190 (-),score=29.82 TRINITY_DN966_c0_g1_i1:56-625(-)
MNNNNNPNMGSGLYSLSDFTMNEDNCAKYIKIINPYKITSTSTTSTDSFVTGNFEFKQNTGLYKWDIRISNLIKRSFASTGVSNHQILNSSPACFQSYGYSTMAYRYKNDGSWDGEVNNIPQECTSMIVHVELNTNNRELKEIFYDDSGTTIYFSETHPIPIKFPVYPFYYIYRAGNKIEVINFDHHMV